MDEQLNRNYRRWLEAEGHGRDDEADALFGAVLRASAAERPVPPEFVRGAISAVADAAERDARRARRMRRTVVPAGILIVAVLAYFGAGLAGTALSVLLVGLLDLLVGLVVNVATTTASGDAWTVMTSLGRVAAALLNTPAVTATILAIQGIALAALLALRHLLGTDGESFR